MQEDCLSFVKERLLSESEDTSVMEVLQMEIVKAWYGPGAPYRVGGMHVEISW